MARAYSLVPQALNQLADRVNQLSRQKSNHTRALQDLNLAESQLGLKAQSLADQHNINIAQAEKEKHLDEVVSLGDVIKSSKIPWEQKQQVLSSFDEKVLNFPTTRRKAMDAFSRLESERIAGERHTENLDHREALTDKQISAQREIAAGRTGSAEKIAQMKIDAMGDRQEKDTRSNMQKEVEFIATTEGVSLPEALKQWQKSKSLPERNRLYNNELEALNNDMSLLGPEGAELKKQKIQELRQIYGINEAMNQKPQPDTDNNDPLGIRF